MSIEPKFGRYCDECGRGIVNAIRVHQGKDYCRACYQRTFLPVPCAICTKQMRAHKHAAEKPVCEACIRSTRTCMRCGRFTPIAGKIIGKSATCVACAPHFREKHPCNQCGRLSSRLSRPLFADMQDPVCDSCRNKLNHATCRNCGKYRKFVGHTAKGTPYCADCIPGSEITHNCLGCGAVVNGSGLSRCRSCTNKAAILKNASFVAVELEAMWCRELWQAFVEHILSDDSSSPQIKSRVEHAADFFRELSQLFPSRDMFAADLMIQKVGSKFFRRHLLASRFVISKFGVSAFEEKRSLSVEQQRIANILDRSSDGAYVVSLSVYAQWLTDQKVAVRTARLYLRAAEGFCAHCKFDGTNSWTEPAMIEYLKGSPGQAASLGRFVTYFRKQRGWDVRIPPKKLWQKNSDMTKSVKNLRKSIRALAAKPDGRLTTKDLARVLSLGLDIPAVQLIRARSMVGVPRRMDGAIEIYKDAVIEKSHPLYRFALRWADLSDAYQTRRGKSVK